MQHLFGKKKINTVVVEVVDMNQREFLGHIKFLQIFCKPTHTAKPERSNDMQMFL